MDDKDEIVQSILNGNHVLIHGCGGSGKSFTIVKVAKELLKKYLNVYITATTGVAAVNLSNDGLKATTLHSWAGIGNGDKPVHKLVAKIKYSDSKKKWLHTDVLIIDEISMLGSSLLDKLDYIGRTIRKDHRPFGGILIIFSGDFLQLPPVKDNWAFESNVWGEITDNMNLLLMETPRRYPDLDWFYRLLRIRRAEHTKDDVKFLFKRKMAYDELHPSFQKNSLAIKPTILYSTKKDVETENLRELNRLGGEAIHFIAHDDFKLKPLTINSKIDNYFIAYDDFKPLTINSKIDNYAYQMDENIPRSIVLKKGAQVMLKYNLDIDEGLCNGSRGVVLNVTNEGAMVDWKAGFKSWVSNTTWELEDKDGVFVRTQIPLVLAWSLTCHKSQGCTLDYVVCNIGPSIFCGGQAYVALSRVKTGNGLFLSDFYPASLRADEKALKYVKSIEESDENIEDVEEELENEESGEEELEESDGEDGKVEYEFEEFEELDEEDETEELEEEEFEELDEEDETEEELEDGEDDETEELEDEEVEDCDSYEIYESSDYTMVFYLSN